jgi:hypothetical protein
MNKKFLLCSVPLNNRNQMGDDHRKRTPIDLDNTEGVFSQQGIFIFLFFFLF